MIRPGITAEQWIRTAIKHIDIIVFENELNTHTHKYQVYFGRIKGKHGCETVQPSDNEDITLDDFFPTTIGVDYQTKDIDQMLANIALECIRAFMGITKGKAYKKKCAEYYFEPPFSEAHVSPFLRDQLTEVLDKTVAECGDFPGVPVKFPTKEPKEKKPTKAVYFCPECGLELTASIKKLKGATGTPTCICGARMGRDLSDGLNDQNNTTEA